jgi:hypothetical protein
MNGYCSGQIWLESDILTRTYQKLRKKNRFYGCHGRCCKQRQARAWMLPRQRFNSSTHGLLLEPHACQLRQACLNVNLASSHCRHEQPHGRSHHKRLSNLKGEFTLSPNSKFLYRRSQIIFFLELFKQYL